MTAQRTEAKQLEKEVTDLESERTKLKLRRAGDAAVAGSASCWLCATDFVLFDLFTCSTDFFNNTSYQYDS